MTLLPESPPAAAALSRAERTALRRLADGLPGLDLACYQRHRRAPLQPVLGLGPACARLAIVGRDPGEREVAAGQPFLGAGGQLLRAGLYQRLHGHPMPDREAGESLTGQFFWFNTVPYKPAGNRAWSMAVKQRFWPPMASILARHWQGHQLITLGREAFLWLGIQQPVAQRRRLAACWADPGRFEQVVELAWQVPGQPDRQLQVYPLPHPSPLNRQWLAKFPELLQRRLQQLDLTARNVLLPG